MEEVIDKTNYLLPKGMPRSHAHLFKNDGQGAKSCKGRLEEIKTDKSCKEVTKKANESLPKGPGFQCLNKDGLSLARSWHSD